MDAVHVWCNDNPAKHTVQPQWNLHIAVIEHRGGVEQHFEDDDRDSRWTKNHDHSEFDERGKQDFQRVEPQTCGYVEVQVSVMDHV